MGCCQTQSRSNQEETLSNIQQSIRRDSPQRLSVLLKTFLKTNPFTTLTIDSPIMKVNSYSFTPLAFCVWQGSFRCFRLLYENFQASIIEMEKNLSKHSFTALGLLCEHSSIELLKYYIPLYLEYQSEIPVGETKTFQSDESIETLAKTIYTPVHQACESGNISILLVIFNYFQDMTSIPKPLDPEYQEESTGENCVFIACRKINLSMIRFLHTKVKASFFVTNLKGEDPLMVLILANRLSPSERFLECLSYLVECVQIDINRNFEQLLGLVTDAEVVKYLRNQLAPKGTTKKLEKSYRTVLANTNENVNESLTNTFFQFLTRDHWKTVVDFEDPAEL